MRGAKAVFGPRVSVDVLATRLASNVIVCPPLIAKEDASWITWYALSTGWILNAPTGLSIVLVRSLIDTDCLMCVLPVMFWIASN